MTLGRRAAAIVAAWVVVIAGCSGTEPDDPAAFCAAMVDAAQRRSPVSGLDLQDPTSVEAAIAELATISAVAPSDVAADADAVARVYRAILETLVATAPGARPEVLRGFQEDFDTVSPAAARLQQYAEATCGVTFAPPPEPTPSPTPLDIVD